MDITSTVSGNKATIELKGRFDFNDNRAFKDAYEPLLGRTAVLSIEIGLAGVDYMDSSALGILMLMRERFHSAGKKVALNNPSMNIREILEIANFGKLFTIN